MGKTSNSGSSSGIGFIGLLTIAFIVLKLTKNIDWSWWWVLSPLWVVIPIAIIVFFIIATFVALSQKRKFKKKYMEKK